LIASAAALTALAWLGVRIRFTLPALTALALLALLDLAALSRIVTLLAFGAGLALLIPILLCLS
jgi:hypothetical protein